MIIDLKRWLFDLVLSFILWWSCYSIHAVCTTKYVFSFSQDIFNTRQYFSWSTPFSLDCNKAFLYFFLFFKGRIMFLHLGSIVGGLPEAIKRLLHASLSWVRAPTKPFISSFSFYRRWVQSMLGHLLTTPALKLWRSDWLMKRTTPEVGNRESVDNSLGQLRGWQQDFHGGFELLSHSLLWLFMLLLLILFNPGGGTMRPPHGF